MQIVTAKLKKLKTEDGLIQMLDHIPIGKEYQVDLDSLEELLMFNLEYCLSHKKVVVHTADHTRFLPIELLDLPVTEEDLLSRLVTPSPSGSVS